MSEPIVSSNDAVTLVGGGHLERIVLNISKTHAPRVVAADGGADRALALGETPEAVIGDLDSLSAAARDLLHDRLHPAPDQDFTDFEKALRAISAPLVIAVGFTGGRLDHTLAALNVMVRLDTPPVVMLDADDAVFRAPPVTRLDLPQGARIALLPMEPCEVSTTGLHWNLDRQTLAPAGLVSSSNRALGPVEVTCKGRCLISLEARHLPIGLAAVRAG